MAGWRERSSAARRVSNDLMHTRSWSYWVPWTSTREAYAPNASGGARKAPKMSSLLRPRRCRASGWRLRGQAPGEPLRTREVEQALPAYSVTVMGNSR
jgi:hypothetical protein